MTQPRRYCVSCCELFANRDEYTLLDICDDCLPDVLESARLLRREADTETYKKVSE